MVSCSVCSCMNIRLAVLLCANVDRIRDVDGAIVLQGVLCDCVKFVRQAQLDSKCKSRRKRGIVNSFLPKLEPGNFSRYSD